MRSYLKKQEIENTGKPKFIKNYLTKNALLGHN